MTRYELGSMRIGTRLSFKRYYISCAYIIGRPCYIELSIKSNIFSENTVSKIPVSSISGILGTDLAKIMDDELKHITEKLALECPQLN